MTPTYVYSVCYFDWDSHEIYSVWDSWQLAYDELERLRSQHKIDTYIIEKHELNKAGWA